MSRMKSMLCTVSLTRRNRQLLADQFSWEGMGGETAAHIALGPDEGKDICIDDVRVSGHEAMWIAGIDFERSVLEQLGLK